MKDAAAVTHAYQRDPLDEVLDQIAEMEIALATMKARLKLAKEQGQTVTNTPLRDVAWAAEVLSETESGVYYLVKRSGLPHVRLSEQKIRFVEADVWAWVRGGGVHADKKGRQS